MSKEQASSIWLVPVLAGSAFFYFLVFAQFGYLHRLADIFENGTGKGIILFLMGAGGIVGSACAARRVRLENSPPKTDL